VKIFPFFKKLIFFSFRFLFLLIFSNTKCWKDQKTKIKPSSQGVKNNSKATLLSPNISSKEYKNQNTEQIDGTVIPALAEALKNRQKLTDLFLNSHHIDDTSATASANASKGNEASKLSFLRLNGNQIKKDGAKNLLEASQSKNSLVSLNLAHNNIGDTGATDIAKALEDNQKL